MRQSNLTTIILCDGQIPCQKSGRKAYARKSEHETCSIISKPQAKQRETLPRKGATDEVELTCMGLHFPITEAYERVEFANEGAEKQ